MFFVFDVNTLLFHFFNIFKQVSSQRIKCDKLPKKYLW